MKLVDLREIFTGILVATGLIGIALIGVAFGHQLRVGDLSSITGHPLSAAGMHCLTSSAIGGLLLLVSGRRPDRNT